MEQLALVSRWIAANYGWLHILFCCAALIYCAYKTRMVWQIPFLYLFVMVIAYPSLYGDVEPTKFYFLSSVFEVFIIAFMLLFRHPMATYIASLSVAMLILHLLALSAYFWLLAFDIAGYHITPLYDAKQAHKVVVPLLESFQLIAVFVFSSPRFKHLDKPVQDKESMTWQAMSARQ